MDIQRRLNSEDIRFVGVTGTGRRCRLLGVLRGGRRQGATTGEASPEGAAVSELSTGKEGHTQASSRSSTGLGQVGGGMRPTVQALNILHVLKLRWKSSRMAPNIIADMKPVATPSGDWRLIAADTAAGRNILNARVSELVLLKQSQTWKNSLPAARLT